jgi:hypothetical protein
LEPKLILAHLTSNEDYARQVMPHLEVAFFEDPVERKLFACAKDYYNSTHGKMPTKEAVGMLFGDKENGMSDEQFEQGEHLLASLQVDPKTDIQWAVGETEKWAKKRAQYVVLMKAITNHKSEKPEDIANIWIAADNFAFKAKNLSDHFMKFGKRAKKRNPIISGLISPEDVTLIIGQAGAFKSFISLLMALCTTTGRDFANHKCQQGAVVIFVGEGDGGIEDRVIALCAQHGVCWDDIPCEIISLSDKDNNCPTYNAESKDGNKERVEWVKAHIFAAAEKYGCDVTHVIFDTFRTAVNGIDENQAKHVTPAMLHFKAIARQTGVAVTVIHHTNRELKDFSGSGSFKSDCDNLYFVEAGKNLTAVLTRNDQMGKQKDFAALDDIAFKMISHVTGEYENGEIVTSLAATFADGEVRSAEPEEDIVLVLVKEHYANEVFNGPLLKSELLKAFKERRKMTGTDDALNKRFREKHFKPLLDDGYISYEPTSYIGAGREDGVVRLVIEAAPLAIAAE